MATPTTDNYTAVSGTPVVRCGIAVSLGEPQWIGAFAGSQSVGHTVGVANSITGFVDTPSSFSVAPGYSLPSGAVLITVSPTQVQIDLGTELAAGSYTLKIRATAL